VLPCYEGCDELDLIEHGGTSLTVHAFSLPFLASLIYSVVLYRREKSSKARNDAGSTEGLLLTTDGLEPASPG
jgi:hypothetical protein